MPSTPAEFKGLLKSAIRDDNPVMFFIDAPLLHARRGPDGDHLVPIGKAAIRRSGTDVTLVSYGKTVDSCLKAAEILEAEGTSAEVVDLRTVKPLEEQAILGSSEDGPRGDCPRGEPDVRHRRRSRGDRRGEGVRRAQGSDPPSHGPRRAAPSSYALEQAFVPSPIRS